MPRVSEDLVPYTVSNSLYNESHYTFCQLLRWPGAITTVLETLFAAVAEAVFNLLVTESGLTERVRAVLGVDPERRAFQLALARASEQFVKQHPD